jgi:hypothetical protein
MGKTRESANLVSENNIFVDIVNDRVGIRTNAPQYGLDVATDINCSGEILKNGLIPGRLGTALTTGGFGRFVYYTEDDGFVEEDTTLTSPSNTSYIYTRYLNIVINDTYTLTIGEDTDFIVDILRLSQV